MLLSVSTSAFAVATGEGAVRLETSTSNYYGVAGYITIPSNLVVSNDGSYVAFYLGLDNKCEGGISYRPHTGWNKFLKCGQADTEPESTKTTPLANQPVAGDQINIKVVNNLNNTASLYINGVEAYTLPVGKSKGTLYSSTKVKMVHSTHDNQDKNSYKNAKFTSVQVKNANGTYTNFPTNVNPTYPWGVGDYTVHSTNPIATSLKAGKS